VRVGPVQTLCNRGLTELLFVRIVEFVVHGEANLPRKVPKSPNVPICGVSQTRLSFPAEEVACSHG